MAKFCECLDQMPFSARAFIYNVWKLHVLSQSSQGSWIRRVEVVLLTFCLCVVAGSKRGKE